MLLEKKFKKKFVLYPVLLSSAFLLSGCEFGEDDDTEEHAESACIESAKEITTSDNRTLCVTLASFKADAPLDAGFKAPGKSTQTVFISDSEGNPLNVADDEVITAVSQYPMMYMDGGHMHSAPYSSADTTAAEYGAYNMDVYFPMGSAMGRWEYRVMLKDNNGTVDDTADDKMYTVTFEPTVDMVMGGKELRAVASNESDKFKNVMGIEATRRYSVWLESVGAVVGGSAAVKVRLTTEDMDSTDATPMSMKPGYKPGARETEPHVHETAHATGDMDMDSDSQTYPAVHTLVNMMGTDMVTTLHDPMNMAVTVDSVSVEVAINDGAFMPLTAAQMPHEELGNFSADIPMTAGAVTMHVKVTVNGNVMTKTGVIPATITADDVPAFTFTAAE